MVHDPIDTKSALLQVLVWCRQATCLYLNLFLEKFYSIMLYCVSEIGHGVIHKFSTFIIFPWTKMLVKNCYMMKTGKII